MSINYGNGKINCVLSTLSYTAIKKSSVYFCTDSGKSSWYLKLKKKKVSDQNLKHEIYICLKNKDERSTKECVYVYKKNNAGESFISVFKSCITLLTVVILYAAQTGERGFVLYFINCC